MEDAQAIKQLHGIFGNDEDMSESVVAAVYHNCNKNIDDAVDHLLMMGVDTTDSEDPSRNAHEAMEMSASSDQKEDEKASEASPHPEDRQDHKNVSNERKKEDLTKIGQIFGDANTHLTQSVIAEVYTMNTHDVTATVDQLLAIHDDEEAIEQVRTLGKAKAKEIEDAMIQERTERILKEQQERKERIEREKALLKRIEEKHRENEEKERAKYEEQIQMLSMRIEQSMLADPEEKPAAPSSVKEASALSANEKVATSEETSPKVVPSQMSDEEQLRILKVKQDEANARHIMFNKRLEEYKRTNQMVLAEEEQQLSRMADEAEACTLGVRYSAKTIVMSWSLGDAIEPSSGDWIGFFKLGADNRKYRNAIKTGGKRRGNTSMASPKTPGLYEFRFFRNSGYEPISRSGIIHVGPRLILSAQLEPETRRINVEWDLEEGELHARDWIGLYKVGSRDKDYLVYEFLAKGSKIQFTAPRTPGEYEVRFLPYRCGYSSVSRSNRVEIQNNDSLTVKSVSSKGIEVHYSVSSVELHKADWIALYQYGMPNNSYVSYVYIDKESPSVVLPTPRFPGQYQVRYHSKTMSRYADVIRSEPFEVENDDVFVATVEGDHVKVTYDLQPSEMSRSDWIGLYDMDKDSKKPIQYKYVDIETKATLFDRPSHSGNFEFRFHSVGYFLSEVIKKFPITF